MRSVDGHLRHKRHAGTVRDPGHNARRIADVGQPAVAEGLADTARVHHGPAVRHRDVRVSQIQEIIRRREPREIVAVVSYRRSRPR